MTYRLRSFGKRVSIAALAALCATTQAADDRPPIVREGQPCADIVIAANPPRAVRLAATELQTYIARISGAELPILTAPGDAPVQIYVGRSRTTDELGLSDEGLADGAYVMRSGPGHLILFGRDRDFVPMEPRLHSAAPQERDRVRAELDALTGSTWDLPQGFHWLGMNASLNIHQQDERGSLNAVYAFLRELGVEWYMPGEQGEIVPRRTTIALPEVDRLVRPDFALRYLHGAAGRFANREATLWYLRLGLNNSSSRTGLADTLSHPLRSLTTREEMRRAHPEYFALRAGRRAIDMNTPCLSSEGLFRETVRYVRFLLDQYDLPLVSLSLEDGAIYCDCPLCVDKKSPELGWTGSSSEYVWAFANRVAREVYTTHPDRQLVMTAYANYVAPPTSIDKLSPNLCVGLVQQRVRHHDPARRQNDLAQRRAWLEKMAPDSRFVMWTHYPYTLRSSRDIPEYFPRRIAEDLRSLKGLSLGEFVEVQFDRDPQRMGAIHAPGFNHLNLFVTARAYWDAELDIDALLSTYTEWFYGPAAAEMRALIEYQDYLVTNYPERGRADKAVRRSVTDKVWDKESDEVWRRGNRSWKKWYNSSGMRN